MAQDLISNVPRNMRRVGMLLFRDAFMEALHGNQLTYVVHAAHAAEILLKARIVQKDLLLIFYKLPKSSSSKDTFTLIGVLHNFGETEKVMPDLRQLRYRFVGVAIENHYVSK